MKCKLDNPLDADDAEDDGREAPTARKSPETAPPAGASGAVSGDFRAARSARRAAGAPRPSSSASSASNGLSNLHFTPDRMALATGAALRLFETVFSRFLVRPKLEVSFRV